MSVYKCVYYECYLFDVGVYVYVMCAIFVVCTRVCMCVCVCVHVLVNSLDKRDQKAFSAQTALRSSARI